MRLAAGGMGALYVGVTGHYDPLAGGKIEKQVLAQTQFAVCTLGKQITERHGLRVVRTQS
tara:strand:- start:2130 stop:2309 length:180 start_codon:yes stop_codon:yes gene_type:complete